MRPRLGLSVSRTEVVATLATGSRIIWQGRLPVESLSELGTAVSAAVAEAPMGRFRKPTVSVALGLAYSQLRMLEGLPTAGNSALLSRIVQENAESFFLRMGSSLITTAVHRMADGTTWAAALDGTVVDIVLSKLRELGFSRISLVPFVAAVARALPLGVHAIVDDGLAVEIEVADQGRILRARRLVRHTPDGTELVEPLAALGSSAVRSDEPFVWRPRRSAAATRTFDRLLVGTAAAAFIAAAATAAIAPGIRAARASAEATRQLASTRRQQTEAAQTDAELRRVTTQLERIARFEASRGHITLLLGSLSQALPESTAIVTLRVDSLEGSFVAIAPHAADILPQLTTIDEIIAPRIVGSVTREAQGGARVERATVRFRRPKPTQ